MSIIKLVPGQRVALTVANTSEVEGNYGPQIKFSGSTPDDSDATIFLNVETAQQQLGRIGYTPESVVGHTVEIERVEKNGRKFTNINRLPVGMTGADLHKSAAPAASQKKVGYSSGPHIPAMDDEHPALPHERLDAQFRLYDLCLAHAHAAATKRFGEDVTDEAVIAATATLYIQATKMGLGNA